MFEPIAPIIPFDMAQRDVLHRDLSRTHRVIVALRAGTIWVNCFFIRDLRAPFGGVCDSGVGREAGDYSRESFAEPKAVVIQISPARD